MARVVINTVESAPVVPFPTLDGLGATGTVATRSVIEPGRPLQLWMHQLSPGASLAWQQPKFGHVLFVWKGDVTLDGQPAATGSVIIVEHRANTRIDAGAHGATLLHYHQSEDLPPLTEKAGGHVHLRPPTGLFQSRDEMRNCTTTVWADAHCPTCDLWLHRSAFGSPRPQSEPHMHSEDEIIFVVEGGTIVGKTHHPGTAIAVDRETIYGFGVAEGGTAFLNFRPSNPFVRMTERGKPTTDWISELKYMRNAAEIAFNQAGDLRS